MDEDINSYIYLLYAQVNPKAAESLADPEEYPNLFDDWQVALGVESKAIEARSAYFITSIL